MNYWVFRSDKKYSQKLFQELEAGRLRQGWGWSPKQNLHLLASGDQNAMDEGARRNLRMLQVKKGDVILALHLPCYGQVALCEATENWDSGYKFEVLTVNTGEGKIGEDYGHIFPSKYIKSFHIQNASVQSGIRSTLRNIGRFWNINHLKESIDSLRTASGDLGSASTSISRWDTVINEVEKKIDFKKMLSEETQKFTQKSEWEHVIAEAIRTIHPDWVVETTSNRNEAVHGTDILVKIPTFGVFDDKDYAICIQVKDYSGKVGLHPLDQMRKSLEGYMDSNFKIIELIVMITNAKEENNEDLAREAAKDDLATPVKIMWHRDVMKMIANAALIKLSKQNMED
jgi:hypothetical protein